MGFCVHPEVEDDLGDSTWNKVMGRYEGWPGRWVKEVKERATGYAYCQEREERSLGTGQV